MLLYVTLYQLRGLQTFSVHEEEGLWPVSSFTELNREEEEVRADRRVVQLPNVGTLRPINH